MLRIMFSGKGTIREGALDLIGAIVTIGKRCFLAQGFRSNTSLEF